MEKLMRYHGKDLQDMNFNTWIKQKPENLQSIGEKWFAEIKACGSDVDDIFHDGYPIGCVDQAPFAYVNIYTAHINVGFFYGVDLPDPHRLLEGKGKRMRHIKLSPDKEKNEEAILALVLSSYRDIKKRLNQEQW